MQEIYLDNAATTRPLDSIRELLDSYLAEGWHNPSALYAPAVHDSRRLEDARAVIKNSFGQGSFEVFFTGSGTEGDATVLLGGAKKRKSMHYISSEAEHAAVYQSMMRLKSMGHEVTFIRPDRHGAVRPEDVASEVREDTVLVSIMHVNNQTGAVSDIAAIAREVKNKNKNTLFHSDGVQAFLRERVSDTSNIDYYTVSAHKIHGLKGAGALFYKKGTPLQPLIPGGGQEKGLRSGTENTFGIAAFAQAVRYFLENAAEISARLRELKETFLSEIAELPGVEILSPEGGASHIVCLSLEGVRGEVLLHALEENRIYISTGSACTSKKGVGRAATALGLNRTEAEGVIRVSFSPFNTPGEAASAAQAIIQKSVELRRFIRMRS
jgi:cysteine desulfurase